MMAWKQAAKWVESKADRSVSTLVASLVASTADYLVVRMAVCLVEKTAVE